MGLHINRRSSADNNNVSNIDYSGNTFASNGTGVIFQQTGTGLTLSFEGSRFTGNGTDIDNRCSQPLTRIWWRTTAGPR